MPFATQISGMIKELLRNGGAIGKMPRIKVTIFQLVNGAARIRDTFHCSFPLLILDDRLQPTSGQLAGTKLLKD
jgi:hypothetical protein